MSFRETITASRSIALSVPASFGSSPPESIRQICRTLPKKSFVPTAGQLPVLSFLMLSSQIARLAPPARLPSGVRQAAANGSTRFGLRGPRYPRDLSVCVRAAVAGVPPKPSASIRLEACTDRPHLAMAAAMARCGNMGKSPSRAEAAFPRRCISPTRSRAISSLRRVTIASGMPARWRVANHGSKLAAKRAWQPWGAQPPRCSRQCERRPAAGLLADRAAVLVSHSNGLAPRAAARLRRIRFPHHGQPHHRFGASGHHVPSKTRPSPH